MSYENHGGSLPEGEPSAGHPSIGPRDQPLPVLKDGGILASTPDCYWHLFNNPGMSPPGLTTRPLVVSPEAFLGLAKKVQEMAGMMQMIIPLISQFVQLATPPTEPTRQRPSTKQLWIGDDSSNNSTPLRA